MVTDDALNATVDDAVQSARGQALAKGITFAGAQRVDTKSFSVEGVEPARVKDVRDILRDFFRAPEWEVREPGEGRFLVQMTDLYVRQTRERTVKEAIRTLERRVNELGVAEPVIAEHGADRRPDPGPAPRASPTPSRPSASSRGRPSCTLKLVESSAASRETLLAGHGGHGPRRTWRSSRARARRPASPSSTWCAARPSSPAAT